MRNMRKMRRTEENGREKERKGYDRQSEKIEIKKYVKKERNNGRGNKRERERERERERCKEEREKENKTNGGRGTCDRKIKVRGESNIKYEEV